MAPSSHSDQARVPKPTMWIALVGVLVIIHVSGIILRLSLWLGVPEVVLMALIAIGGVGVAAGAAYVRKMRMVAAGYEVTRMQSTSPGDRPPPLPMHPVFAAFCYAGLSFLACSLAFLVFAVAITPLYGPSGIAAATHWQGVFQFYVWGVLPASIVLGAMGGAIRAWYRRDQLLHHRSATEDASQSTTPR
jgi:hypothetical protein